MGEKIQNDFRHFVKLAKSKVVSWDFGFILYLFIENVHKHSTTKDLDSLNLNSQKIFVNPQTSIRHNHHTI